MSDFMAEIQWERHSFEHVWVAKDGDENIGCACAEFFRDGELATLAGVFVQEEYRGHSIGLNLSQAVVDYFDSVASWYLAGRYWIEAFYGKMGFETIDEIIPELERDFPNQVFMRYTKAA